MTFLSILLIGCGQETYENGVPTYFVEPDGYIIAEIKCDTNGLFLKNYYGYCGFMLTGNNWFSFSLFFLFYLPDFLFGDLFTQCLYKII